MRPLLLAVTLFFSLGAFAQVKFTNDREGTSYYQNKSFLKHAKAVNPAVAKKAFLGLLERTRPSQLCALDLVDDLQKEFPELKKSKFHHVLNSLRAQNEIDDVVYSILVKAWGVLKTPAKLEINDETYLERLPSDKEELDKKLSIIGTYPKRIEGRCIDEVFKSVHSELKKLDKKITKSEVSALIRYAYEQKKINLYTFGRLEQMHRENANEWRLTLKDYLQKTQILRTQFPLRDVTEKSDFVTQKSSIEKMGHRERLYENYSYIQIALMGNVIKKLKERLDSPKVEILVYDKNEQVNEVVPLEPMERFRFAIKILRKEMHELSINSYFGGRKPSYLDIMAAAYEIGIVTAVEIDEVAGLEEIWNPKKTFWDKARTWVRLAGSVAAIVIPPPYGFIATLAIVAIEATSKKDPNTNLEHSLF